jgi:hypothetical protein
MTAVLLRYGLVDSVELQQYFIIKECRHIALVAVETTKAATGDK